MNSGVKLCSDTPKKLIETLFDKHNYVCHYRNLKFYLKHGLKVKRLHRVLQFRQSKRLGEYISKNTVMRKQAGTDFEKKFYQLMSNACFGKTTENLRNSREILFVSSKEQAQKHLQKPNFKGFQIIHDNLVSVAFSPNKTFRIKPTPVGASILDLSKLCLCERSSEKCQKDCNIFCFDIQSVRRSMTQLRSINHQIAVNRVNKIAVSSYDDKRFLLDDGVQSLAHGHYSLG